MSLSSDVWSDRRKVMLPLVDAEMVIRQNKRVRDALVKNAELFFADEHVQTHSLL